MTWLHVFDMDATSAKQYFQTNGALDAPRFEKIPIEWQFDALSGFWYAQHKFGAPMIVEIAQYQFPFGVTYEMDLMFKGQRVYNPLNCPLIADGFKITTYNDIDTFPETGTVFCIGFGIKRDQVN